jgi:hypothetical protein
VDIAIVGEGGEKGREKQKKQKKNKYKNEAFLHLNAPIKCPSVLNRFHCKCHLSALVLCFYHRLACTIT